MRKSLELKSTAESCSVVLAYRRLLDCGLGNLKLTFVTHYYPITGHRKDGTLMGRCMEKVILVAHEHERSSSCFLTSKFGRTGQSIGMLPVRFSIRLDAFFGVNLIPSLGNRKAEGSWLSITAPGTNHKNIRN